MAWILYDSYHEGVNGKRIRIPDKGSFATAYGKWRAALGLTPGFTGYIIDILTDKKIPTHWVTPNPNIVDLDWTYAAVVRARKQDNPIHVFNELHPEGASEVEIVILRKTLGKMEIEP